MSGRGCRRDVDHIRGTKIHIPACSRQRPGAASRRHSQNDANEARQTTAGAKIEIDACGRRTSLQDRRAHIAIVRKGQHQLKVSHVPVEGAAHLPALRQGRDLFRAVGDAEGAALLRRQICRIPMGAHNILNRAAPVDDAQIVCLVIGAAVRQGKSLRRHNAGKGGRQQDKHNQHKGNQTYSHSSHTILRSTALNSLENLATQDETKRRTKQPMQGAPDR